MHNRQHKKLDYVKEDGDIFTYETSTKNLPDKDVFVYEQAQINELKTLIKEKTGRTSQVKNYYVDGLISLGRDQFLQLNNEQQQKLIDKTFEFVRNEIRDRFQTSVKVCSFHFDEGHKNEQGQWDLNPHIQFTFENVNRSTGKTIQRTFTKSILKELQTKVSEYYQEFGFIRGKDYKAHNEPAPKQVYWKDYKRQKENETKQEILVQVAKVKPLEIENHELKAQLRQLQDNYQQLRDEFKKSGEATQADYQRLKQEKEHLENQLKSSIRANKDLLDKLTHAETINNRLNSEKTALQNELLAIQSLKRLEIEKQEQKAREKTELLKSNDTVLAYYAKINPELVEKVKRNRYLEVPGVNGGIVQLSDNDPHRLAELLGKGTGHKISALNEGSLENHVKDYVYNI